MRKQILILLLTLTSQCLSAQVAIGYFPFQSVLAVSSNTERLVWGDFKIETNTFSTNMNIELSPKFNIKRTNWVNYSIGGGISFNFANSFMDLSPLNGYFLEFGMRGKPIAKCKNFQVVFEISPYANKQLTGGNLRTRLGIAWNFAPKEK